MSITKEQLREYQKRYRAKILNIGISRTLAERLRGIRHYTTFMSDNQTLKYLLDIEKNLIEKKILEIYKSCEHCGKEIEVKLDSYKGIIHRQIDEKSNCPGCITTNYKIKIGHEVKEKDEIEREKIKTLIENCLTEQEKEQINQIMKSDLSEREKNEQTRSILKGGVMEREKEEEYEMITLEL